MRKAIIILGLLLAACSVPKPTVKQVIAQCVLEGDKVHGADPDRFKAVSQYADVCMQAHGYEWRNDKDCGTIAAYDLALQRPECYQPAASKP